MYDNDGYRELDRYECLRLMARIPVGRVIHTRHALPAVLPVPFCLDTDGSVIMRTPADPDLIRAIDGVVVAFEADAVDAVRQCGWSVVVTGAASVITDAAEHERLARTGPRSWAASPREVFVRVTPDLVSGRELVAGRDLDASR